jgi:DNA-directed RNA polymerase beta' subunit
MEIFINEVCLEGQYLNEAEFTEAVKVFKAIFEVINEKIKDKQIYKENSTLFVNYEAVKGSNFYQSLKQIKDKSLKLAFENVLFNKLNPKEWRKEQVHSSTDSFDCLMINEQYKVVNDTS